ncbi:MAG: Fic family protein [Propionibacteriaceae bacterium]|nr:Fic family protein [Propionibacteriaceae bacterium]
MSTWPSVDYEESTWLSAEPGMSRNQRRRALGVYRSTITPAIAKAPVELDPSLEEQVADAESSIAAFDASSLRSLPFAAILLRSESASSSQIEQLTASARRLSLAMLGDSSSANATLIARNVRALTEATRVESDIDLDEVLAIHQRIMEQYDPENAGALRPVQVWVGGASPVVARYVAPKPELVPDAMSDLVHFIRRGDVSPLTHAAIAHAQFETIHPFTDGNGRTGRALVTVMLRRSGLAPHVPIPLSAGLLTNTDTYFAALEAYRDGDPSQIITRFIDATHAALDNATRLRDDIEQARQAILETVTRRSAALVELTDLSVAEGAFTARSLADAGIALPTAYRIIERLLAAGLLREERKLHGSQVWSVPAVFRALDAFAQRAGRRSWQ